MTIFIGLNKSIEIHHFVCGRFNSAFSLAPTCRNDQRCSITQMDFSFYFSKSTTCTALFLLSCFLVRLDKLFSSWSSTSSLSRYQFFNRLCFKHFIQYFIIRFIAWIFGELRFWAWSTIDLLIERRNSVKSVVFASTFSDDVPTIGRQP